MSSVEAYKDLEFLKVNEDGKPITLDSDISVRKIVEGFGGMGFTEEGRMVEYFLKSIGNFEPNTGYAFTPRSIQRYLDMMRNMAAD